MIPRSIWSHEEFSFDSSTGDILQDNPESTGRYDRLIRRWIGVVLKKPDPSTQRFSQMFHGKPIAHDGLLPVALEQQTPPPPSKAIARLQTKVTSLKACEAWLKEIMAGSPNQRISSKKDLWAEAQQKWPDTLSHRQFLAAREAAIRATRAVAWEAGGAPKKPQH